MYCIQLVNVSKCNTDIVYTDFCVIKQNVTVMRNTFTICGSNNNHLLAVDVLHSAMLLLALGLQYYILILILIHINIANCSATGTFISLQIILSMLHFKLITGWLRTVLYDELMKVWSWHLVASGMAFLNLLDSMKQGDRIANTTYFKILKGTWNDYLGGSWFTTAADFAPQSSSPDESYEL